MRPDIASTEGGGPEYQTGLKVVGVDTVLEGQELPAVWERPRGCLRAELTWKPSSSHPHPVGLLLKNLPKPQVNFGFNLRNHSW